jgi:rubredoxin
MAFMRKLFQSGGELGVQDLGGDRYEMNISVPRDSDGRMARECPDHECSPGYFKVTPGTGITENHLQAYCPYCRHSAEPNNFTTQEQQRYAKDLVMREVQKNLNGVIKDALGLGANGKRKFGGGLISMEMSLKESPLPHVRRPFEDDVRRDVICPHCSLDQTVFGLAVWCADCGTDIFMSHINAEVSVTRQMLGDVQRRTEMLGKRVAAKDLENCLEDGVSLFEAAMRALVRRALIERGAAAEDVERQLTKLGNAFQNIGRTRHQMAELFAVTVPEDGVWGVLATAFEKRHPITHNLGVVDRKYLERAKAAERHGREVRIVATEIEQMLAALYETIAFVHGALFPMHLPRSDDAQAEVNSHQVE